MTRIEHLLTILIEECSEITQRASKALRFGLSEIQPGQEKTNTRRLMDEINDFIAVYGLLTLSLTQEVSWDNPNKWESILAKQKKVQKFLEYSLECGTLKKE